MPNHSTKSQFSDRELAFLLNQVNRSAMLGLSIDPSSVDKGDGVVRFRATYWGEQSLATFIAPLDETLPGHVRIKSILCPTATNEQRSWSDDGMSTGGYKVILWSLRPQPYMTLSKEGCSNIPEDFKIEPWLPSVKTTPPRSVSEEMLDRIRLRTEDRNELDDTLSKCLEENTVLDRAQPR